MLSAHHLFKSYGFQSVFQDISFSLSAGERAGLIGPNGCGKTTLLRILAGLERPDSGTVAHTRPGLRLGYLAQGFDLDPSLSLEQAIAPARDLEDELSRLAAALAGDPSNLSLQTEYDEALVRLSTQTRKLPGKPAVGGQPPFVFRPPSSIRLGRLDDPGSSQLCGQRR